jgi:CheY-like chemotaxis protein
MLARSFNILLVEDNPADIRLVKEAFKETDIETRLDVVIDGVAAMEYLYSGIKSNGDNLPDLILLDLNLPKKDGREVLVEIKENNDLKRIPVVILTTSSSEEDISETYAHYANSYVVKPANVGRFIETLKNLEDYWFNQIRLP